MMNEIFGLPEKILYPPILPAHVGPIVRQKTDKTMNWNEGRPVRSASKKRIKIQMKTPSQI